MALRCLLRPQPPHQKMMACQRRQRHLRSLSVMTRWGAAAGLGPPLASAPIHYQHLAFQHSQRSPMVAGLQMTTTMMTRTPCHYSAQPSRQLVRRSGPRRARQHRALRRHVVRHLGLLVAQAPLALPRLHQE